MTQTQTSDDVLKFWFEDSTPGSWFGKDPDFDTEIERRFGQTITKALAGRLDRWADTAAGCLALIIVLDQFTRNVFRDTPRAFAGDEMALALSLRCVERGYVEHPDEAYRQFMLMPMMHSEDLSVQDRSLPLFRKYCSARTHDYAVRHRDIIAMFGRFPHRNKILGRPSSDEERAFLTQPGSSF